MKYRIGTYPDASGGEKVFRFNDGAMTVGRSDGEGNFWPVLTVPRMIPAKRGEAWRAPDPKQEAFAAHVVALLNAAEADGREPAGLQPEDADPG